MFSPPGGEERIHSALKYLRPVDYDRGNAETLLVERKRKLREATARLKEVNRWADLTTTEEGIYYSANIDLSEND